MAERITIVDDWHRSGMTGCVYADLYYDEWGREFTAEELIDWCVESGADHCETCNASAYAPPSQCSGYSALADAAAAGNLECIRMLASSSPSTVVSNALLEAVTSGRAVQAELLLAARADPDMRDANGVSLLDHAVRAREVEVVRTLIASGADVAAGSSGTPLMTATMSGSTELVSLLLSSSASVNTLVRGHSSLMVACMHGNVDLTRLLILAGSDLDAVDSTIGFTSLMFACQDGHEKVARLLLVASSNVDIRSHAGDSAFDLACMGGFENVASLLRSGDVCA